MADGGMWVYQTLQLGDRVARLMAGGAALAVVQEDILARRRRSSRRELAAVRRFIETTQQLADNQIAHALPLRRDMVTLLTYLRDNRVRGTTSTGNLTLKAVREVTARFVHPPQLDHTIGDHTYRLRSEDDVWPLVFLHALAYMSGLLVGGPSRPWELTSNGAKFLNVPPPVQVWMMFNTWWTQMDWIMAFPIGGLGEDLPPRFGEITLAHLLSLPVGTPVPFEPFADRLIQETGLTWRAPKATSPRTLLHGAIRRMVINVLTSFEGAEPEYRDKPLGAGTIRELVAFQITPFGRGLLESVVT